MKQLYLISGLFAFLSFLFGLTDAQKDCSQAPTAAARILCEQLHKWDTNARAAPPVSSSIAKPPAIPGLPEGMAAELAPVAATPYQCMDLGCLCSYMGGNGQQGSNFCSLANGQPLQKAIRKEYRTLSDEERNRLHMAIKTIKDSGEYGRIATIHSQFATSGSAHSGPGFLPWHREFIKRYEIALRQVDPTISLPYWDSTIDGHLPTPADSIIFSNDFAGQANADGSVSSGPWAGFRTISGRSNIQRRVGGQGTLFQDSEINWFLQQTQIEMILAFTAPQQSCPVQLSWNVLEYTHGNVHLFIGGDMGDQSTAANDPIFFFHHSFVDMVWELWRQSRQDRNSREKDYPLDNAQCSSPQHFSSAQMSPFEPWNNNDGLSNKYTENLFEYAPRPSCPDCGGSKYLFCDRERNVCLAKVKVGGNCQGLPQNDACYAGECQGGRCVQTQPTPPPTPPPVIPTQSPVQPTRVSCYNEHECCSTWSEKGECFGNAKYMKTWCKASCGVCQVDYNLNDECTDRHQNCRVWAQSGECQRNKFWMAENCRQSCDRCRFSRMEICSGGQGSHSVTVAPPAQPKCASPGCFNENICCQLWGWEGECRRNTEWMQCNCKVSCGKCIPQDYLYGGCTDYHPQCRSWAGRGECVKSSWMLENCRLSCRTCLSLWELRQMCRNTKGAPNAIFGEQIASENGGGMMSRLVREAQTHTGSVTGRNPQVQAMISGLAPVPFSVGMPSV